MTIAILFDQNVPPQVADFLRNLRPNWNIIHAGDVGLSCASDQMIFDYAQSRSAVVITFDEDFADTRMYPVGSHAGVIRLRVWPTTIEHAEQAIERLLRSAEEDILPGSLIIIDNHRIRIRRAARHG